MQLLKYKDTQVDLFTGPEESYTNVPSDFISLTTFLVENMYSQVKRTKISRFCSKFNKSMTFKRPRKSKSTKKLRNVLLIDYPFVQPNPLNYLFIFLLALNLEAFLGNLAQKVG